MYLYNNKQYESEFSARWAAFFEKLGISFTYQDDNPERFVLDDMKIVALVTQNEPSKNEAAKNWMAVNNVPAVDTGKFSCPTGNSAALLIGSPWHADGVVPMGTMYSKQLSAPEIMSIDGKQTGFFLTIQGYPALAVEHLPAKVHCGGYLLSAGDLVQILSDNDKKIWQEAALYARDVVIEPVMSGLSLLKSFDLADSAENAEPDPLSDFKKKVADPEPETAVVDKSKNQSIDNTSDVISAEKVENNLRPFGPINAKQQVINQEVASATSSDSEPPTNNDDEEVIEDEVPDTVEVADSKVSSDNNNKDIEEDIDEDGPVFDTSQIVHQSANSKLTNEEIKNIADEAEENLNTIKEEEKIDVTEKPIKKKKNIFEKFLFEDEEESEDDSKQETSSSIDEASMKDSAVTATPAVTEDMPTQPSVVLKADDPQAPNGSVKKEKVINWIMDHYQPSDTVNHEYELSELIEQCSQGIGVEVTHDEFLWSMLKKEFPYQQYQGREYFGLKKM